MATAAAVAAATGILTNVFMGILVPAVSRKLEYRRNLKKNMITLRKELERLKHMKADVDVELRKRTRRPGKMKKKEVEHWLSRVIIIKNEVQLVEELFPIFSHGFLGKAWLGELVVAKMDEVKELLQQGKFSGDIVTDRPSTS